MKCGGGEKSLVIPHLNCFCQDLGWVSAHVSQHSLLLCISQYVLILHKNWNTVCNLHGKGSKLKSSEVEQKHSISQHQTLKASTSTQNGWPHRHTAKLTQAGPRGEKNHLEH
jgi:hypothetical protein